jgi:hypothetical protein
MKLLIMHVERGVLDSWKPECRATRAALCLNFNTLYQHGVSSGSVRVLEYSQTPFLIYPFW